MDKYLDEYGCEPDAYGTAQSLGTYDIEVMNGYGYYDLSGNFHRYIDSE